ncbi:MAG: DUF6499 domain-containing protein [Methylomonas sp.]|jgi:hypothetical protein
MNSSWLPDWRNESEYPDPKTTTGRQWAWEFLRRNPEYQNLYAEYDRLSTKKPLEEHPVGYEYLDKNTAIDYFRQFKSDEAYRQSDLIRQEMLKKFGVRVWLHDDLLAPACTDIKRLAFQSDFYPPFIVFRDLPLSQGLRFNGKDGFTGFLVPIVPRKEGEITIKFDPNYSIDSQLDAAKAILEERWSEEGKRLRMGIYVQYLRILDAIASGIDKAEIKRILYPNLGDEYPDIEATKKLSKQQKAAEKLRDEDYKQLILK